MTGRAMAAAATGRDPAVTLRDLVTAPGRRNPYPLYEELRAHGSLVTIKPGLMVVLGYAECDRILRQNRLRVMDRENYGRVFPDWPAHSALRGYLDSMLYRNGVDHTRMRNLFSGAFTRTQVSRMRLAIEDLVERLVEELGQAAEKDGSIEFIEQFASRLPIAVISSLLGVPEADQAWFRAMAADITIALEGLTTPARLHRADTAMDHLTDYFTRLIELRRKAPAPDLISELARACAPAPDLQSTGPEAPLTPSELLGNMVLVLTAGFETTSFLLGHALLHALAQPEHAARLRSDPDFAPGYVEEVLRFEPPVQATSRWADEEVDLLGTPIAAGTKIVVMLAAGNRDPDCFDRPAAFDPDRPYRPPLSFGVGSHFCLGAPLSRMEVQIALPALLRRFPALAAAGPPVRRDTWVGRGIDHFPITLGRRSTA